MWNNENENGTWLFREVDGEHKKLFYCIPLKYTVSFKQLVEIANILKLPRVQPLKLRKQTNDRWFFDI